MKTEKLRILLLEDSKLDAELIRKELAKDGFLFESIRVDTKDDYLKQLRSYQPDVILSDFSLPQYDGISALLAAVDEHPEIPFIIITGSLSEEVAADCIKSGAWDYVVKERLFRLGSVLKNALELKKEKDNYLEAEETRKRYEFIINTSNIPMSLINRDYTYEAVNDAYCRMRGLGRKKIIGHSVQEVWKTQGDVDFILQNLKTAFSGKEISYNAWFETDDGGLRYFNVSFCPYFNQDKNLSHVVVTSHDLTDNKLAEDELRKLSIAVEQSPGPVVITDPDGKIEYVNPRFTELTGYTYKEVIGRNPSILKSGYTSPEEYTGLWQTIEAGNIWKGEFKNKRKDGSLYWEYAKISPIVDENGNITNYVALKEDITQRKIAEEELQESERRIRTIMDYSPIAMLQQNYSEVKKYLDGLSREKKIDLSSLEKNDKILKKCLSLIKLEYINKAAKDLLAVETTEQIESNRQLIYTIDTMKSFAKGLLKIVKLEKYYQFETAFINFKGQEKNCLARLATIPGHEETYDLVILSILDITPIKKAEAKLKSSLEEKEIMLKEIHHRVKNNLQIISSLLNMQIRYIEDETAQGYLLESLNRVKSMALIHENLYRSKNLKEIDFSYYINLLINQLFTSYGKLDSGIESDLDIENLTFNINLAIPLGLIINELITNSLKYAFKDREKGLISIRLKKKDGQVEMIISDNGIGIDKNVSLDSVSSLGMQLVKALTKQIHGEIKLVREQGTRFEIRFKEMA